MKRRMSLRKVDIEKCYFRKGRRNATLLYIVYKLVDGRTVKQSYMVEEPREDR